MVYSIMSDKSSSAKLSTLTQAISSLRIHSFIAFAILNLLSLTKAFAAVGVTVEDAYVRETIPGTTISSAYMKISNASAKNLAIVKATSSVSPRVELHEHSMADGMMRMRQVAEISLPAQTSIVLQPSGLHVMLFDLEQPLQAGQSIELVLHFANGTEQPVTAHVQSIKQKRAQQTHVHHH